MSHFIKIIICIAASALISCSNAQNSGRTKVLIVTNLGDITIELYDETPKHRDNFIKLVKEGFYEGILFHRVMENFMVQAGDPKSIGAKPGARLGGSGPGYTIEAEFNERFFHKKGALAAARQPDRSNPEKRSSGSQVYVVQGEVFSPGKLDTLEMRMNSGLLQKVQKQCFGKAQAELNKYRQEGKQEEFSIRVAELRAEADSIFQSTPKKSIPVDRRQIYSTLGGYPSLDGEYTVFGEVVDGIETIDAIAAVETDKFNRPIADVVIQKMELVK